MRSRDGGTRDTGLSWRRGAGRARWGQCRAQELVAVVRRRACDPGRAELRPQRVARVRGPAWHGGPTLPSERTRLVCVTSLRPEDTSRGPGRAGAAPHGECPRPRGGPGRCGAAPRTPSRCRASGPQQRAQAAFSEDRGARAGAVAPSEEAALGWLLRAEAASIWLGRPCALRTRRCG